MVLSANVLTPGTSDGTALGTGSLMWSDLFLASGSVINFNNGDVTLTHSANTLTAAGGTVATAALTSSTITASGIIKTDDTTEATSTTDGSLQTDGGLSVAKDAVLGNDVKLLSDAAVLNFGADNDVSLTHVADTALLLNSSRQLQFGDSGTYIHQSADGVLDLVSDTEIEINATTIDINGNVEISGDLTVSGDDITMGTNTSGAALIADGTNFNPVVISGDIAIGTDGAASIQANSVDGTHIALGSDASGDVMYYNGTNYVRLAKGDDDQVLTLSSGVPTWAAASGGGSSAADDISTGDAAVTIATSAGNITIDAQGNDTDIIFKGTDGSSDTTFLTLDGSDAGTATFNHDIILGDNSIIKLGAAPDLQIYHDTSNSIIADSGTGALQLRSSQVNLMKADGSASLLQATDGGSVELYHNATKMLETTSDGVGIPDNKKLELGDGDDLQIYHETTNNHSIIRENGGGHLKLQGENILLMNPDASETYVECVHNGSTQLYYDNSKKVETASAGISVTGTIVATSNITAYSSDERLKDLKGTIDNALDKIDRVNGYYYKWNDTAREIDSTAFKEGIEIGVSAQEIEKVLPEVVTEAPIVDIHKLDVDYKTVYYDKIVPLLIEGIKELNKKIRKLEEGQNK